MAVGRAFAFVSMNRAISLLEVSTNRLLSWDQLFFQISLGIRQWRILRLTGRLRNLGCVCTAIHLPCRLCWRNRVNFILPSLGAAPSPAVTALGLRTAKLQAVALVTATGWHQRRAARESLTPVDSFFFFLFSFLVSERLLAVGRKWGVPGSLLQGNVCVCVRERARERGGGEEMNVVHTHASSQTRIWTESNQAFSAPWCDNWKFFSVLLFFFLFLFSFPMPVLCLHARWGSKERQSPIWSRLWVLWWKVTSAPNSDSESQFPFKVTKFSPVLVGNWCYIPYDAVLCNVHL